MTMRCPSCSTEAIDGGAFCEECGASLKGAAASRSAEAPREERCTGCGAGAKDIDEDGFCTQCGALRVQGPSKAGHRHFEDALSADVAGVTDIGNAYHENQDYFVIGRAEAGATVAVVCDGVSQSQNASEGAKVSCRAALDFIRENASEAADPRDVVEKAMFCAQQAICKLPFAQGLFDDGEPIPPAQATLVGALVRNRRVTIGWIGDSRAYWITRKGVRQLTTDHSWFNDVVASGEMTAAEARADKRARAIVRSLGASLDGKNQDIEPETLTLNVIEPGLLLIATDGFYVYADESKIAEIVKSHPPDIDALTLARSMVKHARDAGGRDNITTVVFRFDK